MNGALHTIFDGPTPAIVETMRINVQDDIQLPLHLTGPPPPILPFTTSLPFHLIVNTMPMDLHTAAFLVLSYPRTPIGETCKMKLGQVVIMHPDFTVSWCLAEAENIDQFTVKYTATNRPTGVARHIYIRSE